LTETEIARTLEAFRAAKDRHDVDAVVELRTEDCVDLMVATGLRLEGKPAIARYFRAFFASVPDYRGEFDGVAYGAGSAVVWGQFAGTVSEQMLGTPVKGSRRLRVPCVFVVSFRDGRVVEDRQYWDAATLADQLGVALSAIRPTTPT
jgi:steroid delta-isomerase-like uncharacterized protein